MRRRRRQRSPRDRERLRRLRRERRRERRRQHELVEGAGTFVWVGGALLLLGVLVGSAGGSATLAWTLGTAGAWGVLFGFVLPFVARRGRLTWSLVAIVACTALSGGVAYILVPSDVTWWIGQLTAVPAAALAAYFHEPPADDGRHFDRTSGEAWAPPDGGGNSGG